MLLYSFDFNYISCAFILILFVNTKTTFGKQRQCFNVINVTIIISYIRIKLACDVCIVILYSALHGIFKPPSARLYSICARNRNQSLKNVVGIRVENVRCSGFIVFKKVHFYKDVLSVLWNTLDLNLKK